MSGDDKEYLWEVPGMHSWHGVLCPTDMTPEICKWVDEEFEFKDDDVLLLHYCSSGECGLI